MSSLFVFSPTQMNFFPSSPQLLEPTRLLNLDKKIQPTLLLEPPLELERHKSKYALKT